MTVKIMVKGKPVHQEVTDAQIMDYVRELEMYDQIMLTVAYEQYCKANPGVLTKVSDVFA